MAQATVTVTVKIMLNYNFAQKLLLDNTHLTREKQRTQALQYKITLHSTKQTILNVEQKTFFW